ncbi:hypothetical protein H5410_032259 [Solanum commersonii]|uniref:Uncharacterized protein n=1 Tax=Solanum commersonii TaxID=4109 RepID=A0A9J5YKK9_SOLCO|nr:hypothetical protein H5410_032259 [Solanum commersonii]
MAILDDFRDFCVLECSMQNVRSGQRIERILIAQNAIENILSASRQSLSLTHVHEMLSNKVFTIQLRKSSWGSSNTTHTTLSILSYTEKKHAPQTTTDRTSKKIKPLEITEVEVITTTTAPLLQMHHPN